jgi:hypothetical protein
VPIGRRGNGHAAVITNPGERGVVLAGRRIDPVELLDIVRDDHAGHDALGRCDPHRAVDLMARRRGMRALVDIVMCDVLEQRRPTHTAAG